MGGGLVLAVAAAASYGTADFLGGLASRRSSALLVTLCSQIAGLLLVLPLALLQAAPASRASLAWGALGGLCGCLGLIAFFRALADGEMSAAAPVTAVVSAGLPVAIGVAIGERPAPLAWFGAGAGLVAVTAISRGAGRSAVPRRRTLALAVAAGVGFGLFFTCLSRTPSSSGLWPLAGARVGSVTLLSLALLAGRQPWRMEPPALRLAALSGALDMAANGLFLLAVRQGELSLMAVLVSLYPAATVVLALAVLRERLRTPQLAGVALALVAVGLIARG